MACMTKDREIAVETHSISTMEDFGRFSPAKMSDSDTEITDEGSGEEYSEENAGA
jgi:hypothetical protein